MYYAPDSLNGRSARVGNKNMQTLTEESVITQKTRELCQAILDQPNLRAARQNVGRFMADERARQQYESVMAKGQALHEKQHNSEPLTEAEVKVFETERDALLGNPVARGFLDAQEELQGVHKTINQYVSKTLELGAVPTEADFEEHGSCGHGCGCGHSH